MVRRDDVPSVGIRRFHDDLALFGKDRLLAARTVREVKPDAAGKSVDLHRLRDDARRAGGLEPLPLRVRRLPVVDAVDELPREPVAEVPHVVRRTRVRQRTSARQRERMEERTALGRLDLEVPHGPSVAREPHARRRLRELRRGVRGERRRRCNNEKQFSHTSLPFPGIIAKPVRESTRRRTEMV